MWSAFVVAMMTFSAGLAAGLAAPPEYSGPCSGPEERAIAGENAAPSCRLNRLDAAVSIDIDNSTMDASVRTALRTGTDGSYLLLRLNHDLNITQLTDESFGPLSFRWTINSFINISLGRTVNSGTDLAISFSYHGQIRNSDDGNASFWDYIGLRYCWVRTYGLYFPSDQEGTRTPSTINITVPENLTAVSAGDLVSETFNSSSMTRSFLWNNSRELKGISFVVGNYTHSSYTFGAFTFDTYFYAGNAASAQPYCAELASVAAFYTNLIGTPGFGKLSVVELPNNYSAWGQTVPGMLWLASRNFNGELPYRILSHELAHQWWGIDVEGTGLGENWVQEGFAAYSEALYEMSAHSQRGYLDYCKQRYIQLFSSSPEPEPSLTSNNYELASTKGPWVLHMLRYLAGDGNFNQTLKVFHASYLGRGADHIDYRRIVENITGQNFSEFFNFWFYTSGRLDYAAGFATVYEGPAGTDRLVLTFDNRGRAIVPVDLGVSYNGQERGYFPRVWNGSGASGPVRVDVDYRIDTVETDPHDWLLDINPANNNYPAWAASVDFGVENLLVGGEMVQNRTMALTVNLTSSCSQGPYQLPVCILANNNELARRSVTMPKTGRVFEKFNITLPAGGYNITVRADPDDVWFETDETNNNLSVPLTVVQPPAPFPDLLIIGVGAGHRATEGEAVTITADIGNAGLSVADNVTVDFWAASDIKVYIGRSAPVTVTPGKISTASVEWTAPPGTVQLTAKVNPDGELPEISLANNELSGSVRFNLLPRAIISVTPSELSTGEYAELSGLSSTDDGIVSEYLFDYGDGELSGWLPDATSFHRYLVRGQYLAKLRVRDNEGAESNWSAHFSIRLTGLPPVARISLRPSSGLVTTAFNFTSASTDDENNITETVWNFGDGKTARGILASHRYQYKGIYCVTLNVRDNTNLSSFVSMIVNVKNTPPEATIFVPRMSSSVGEYVRFSANASDPDDLVSTLQFIWDFNGQGASGAHASFVFGRPGNYRVTLRVSDGSDSTTETSLMFTVTAAATGDVPPAAGVWTAGGCAAGSVVLALSAAAAGLMFAPRRKKKSRMKIEEE